MLENTFEVRATRVLSSVLFSDIVGSTDRATALGDHKWSALLDQHDGLVEAQIKRYRGQMIKSTGDGVLATFDAPGRAVDCARAMREGARHLDLDLRVGVHTGEIELRGAEIDGLAVNIAARVEAAANDGEIFVTRTVTDLVAGSDLRFDDRGEYELKGIANKWQLFAVAG